MRNSFSTHPALAGGGGSELAKEKEKKTFKGYFKVNGSLLSMIMMMMVIMMRVFF